MDLLHRTWGYMLTTNLSVQSTLLEGFQRDGSVLYGISYEKSAQFIHHPSTPDTMISILHTHHMHMVGQLGQHQP